MNDKRLDTIENKIDRLDEINGEQNVTLGKMEEILRVNTESLQTHMKRTEYNEHRILKVEQELLTSHSFIKGSIWAISIFWAIIVLTIGIYLAR
jgi:hypothetical protein